MNMGRTEIDKGKIKQFILFVATNEKRDFIMGELGLTQPSYYAWKKRYQSSIEKKKEEMYPEKHENTDETYHEGEEEVKKLKEYTPALPSHAAKEKEKKEKVLALPNIERETVKKTITHASESVSRIASKEITSDYQAAQVLKSARVRYQRNIEYMGISWDDFLAVAIDEGYSAALQTWKEKVEEEMYENTLLTSEIEEKLENADDVPEDVEKEEVENE
jgi:hypothetical protein